MWGVGASKIIPLFTQIMKDMDLHIFLVCDIKMLMILGLQAAHYGKDIDRDLEYFFISFLRSEK